MEELPPLQEMALGGPESIMIAPSQQDNRINIEDILTNYQSNSQRNEEKKRGSYYSLDSVSSPSKQVAGFSQNTQSTENQQMEKKMTRTNHKSPLTANSIPLNKSGVAVQSKSTKRKATYHQLVNDICRRHSELDPISKGQSLYFNCLVCSTLKSPVPLSEMQLHLAEVHPQVFFADLKSPNVKESTLEETSFRNCCIFILQSETYQTNPELCKNVEKNLVAYCHKEGQQHLVLDFRFGSNKAKHKTVKKVRASNPVVNRKFSLKKSTCSTTSNKPRKGDPIPIGVVEPIAGTSYGIDSHHTNLNDRVVYPTVLATQREGTIPTEFNAIESMVNMELQEPSQNLEYKCRGESGGQEFAQKDKYNTTSNTVEQGNSTGFGVVAEPVAGTSFGGNFLNNGNVNAVYLTTTPLNFHEASLESQSYMNSNRVMPNVCLNPASFATFSNYLPIQPTTTTTSNYGNVVFTNNIQQPIFTLMEPGNIQNFIPLAPLIADEQQQMGGNQAEILASQPVQAYSFPSSSRSASTMNQVLPYQPLNNSTTSGSNDDNIIATSHDLESILLLETFPPSFDTD